MNILYKVKKSIIFLYQFLIQIGGIDPFEVYPVSHSLQRVPEYPVSHLRQSVRLLQV